MLSKKTIRRSLSLVAVFALSHALPSFAEEGGAEDFAKRKTEILGEIDQRIQKMQEHKTCVSNAANRDALKACRASMKEWRQGEKEERMENRKSKIDERIKKLEEKKAKSGGAS